MKLNPDCIRDVMLTLEDNLSVQHQEYAGQSLFRFVPMRMDMLLLLIVQKYGYQDIDIVYSVLQLVESGYIITSGDLPVLGKHNRIVLGDILYITPKGHEFVASIHNQNEWKGKIKPILGKVGAISLSIIETVAKGVTSAAIERLLAAPDSN